MAKDDRKKKMSVATTSIKSGQQRCSMNLANVLKNLDNPNDYYKSLMGLNYIIQQNIYHILADFNMVHRTHQTASSVRLVFECVADATYMQKNAVEYYNAQQKIQTDLKAAISHADKWQVFKEGAIKKYGRLR